MTLQQPTVRALLKSATDLLMEKGVDTARLDSELLLAHALGWERIGLFKDYGRPLSREEGAPFEDLLKRRALREPMAYILGKKEFWSLDFKTDPRALIPRPETELLVKCVLDYLQIKNPMGLDIGTGSGVLPIVLAKELDNLKIYAVDCSRDALDLARENAMTHDVAGKIEFIEGNLFESLGPETQAGFDFIVSNPPYVPTPDLNTLEPELTHYEPVQALDGGQDGLDIIRKIILGAPEYLKVNGFLCLEIGIGQSGQLKDLISECQGFGEPILFKDLAGIDRVVVARYSGIV